MIDRLIQKSVELKSLKKDPLGNIGKKFTIKYNCNFGKIRFGYNRIYKKLKYWK